MTNSFEINVLSHKKPHFKDKTITVQGQVELYRSEYTTTQCICVLSWTIPLDTTPSPNSIEKEPEGNAPQFGRRSGSER